MVLSAARGVEGGCETVSKQTDLGEVRHLDETRLDISDLICRGDSISLQGSTETTPLSRIVKNGLLLVSRRGEGLSLKTASPPLKINKMDHLLV